MRNGGSVFVQMSGNVDANMQKQLNFMDFKESFSDIEFNRFWTVCFAAMPLRG